MGNRQTNLLDQEEITHISQETGFKANQINRLYKRYLSLDKDKKGFLTRKNFLLIPELAINPLGDRIVHEFFRDSGEELSFIGFLKKLAPFKKTDGQNVHSSKEAKLRFLFGLYDLDNDQTISRFELLAMLQMLVGSNITEEQLANIGERTMTEVDLDNDGYISYPEFVTIFDGVDIESKMFIRFLE